jgi:fructose-bisphosphate aldolase class I
MQATARALVAPGKGILAADESFPTIEKRFKAIDLESTEATRCAYREMLFTTPGIGQFLSGVILFDETIRQQCRGVSCAELLQVQGMIPGIKVDKGAKPLAGFPGEKITQGLDGLRERFAEYREMGALFSKWRAVISIGEGIPTTACLKTNAHALARFAALSQEAGLVPIVEPEVLMDGDHTIDRCEEVTEAALYYVFDALFEQRIAMEKMLLKPNMVVSGKKSSAQAGLDEVADRTIRCLRRTVPAAVPGIVFLSGGQASVDATEHLSAMNKLGPHPWELSFSFGRALQDDALRAWQGHDIRAGQQALYRRARLNSLARFGKYSREMEDQGLEAQVVVEEALRQAAA